MQTDVIKTYTKILKASQSLITNILDYISGILNICDLTVYMHTIDGDRIRGDIQHTG